MPNRYTIVCEFRGGTYVSQVHAANEVDAVRCWADCIRADRPIPRSSAHVATSVLRDLEEHGVAALDGLKGVWSFSALMGRSLVLGNVVLSR
jgi:hypothetical protein